MRDGSIFFEAHIAPTKDEVAACIHYPFWLRNHVSQPRDRGLSDLLKEMELFSAELDPSN